MCFSWYCRSFSAAFRQDMHCAYMCSTLYTAGELYDQIRSAKRLSLPQSQFYAAEIVLMLEYLQVVLFACL